MTSPGMGSETTEVRLNPSSLEVPGSWESAEIGDVSTLVTDGAHQTPTYVEEGVRFLSTQNLRPFRDYFDYADYERHIPPGEHEALTERCKPTDGDLLVSKCGTIGQTQLIRGSEEFSIFVGLALVKPNDRVNGSYLEQVLNWRPLRMAMEARSPGSTRKTLPIFALKGLPIPLPPLDEQRKIASVLYAVDNLIQNVGEAIDRLIRLRRGVRRRLLSHGTRDTERAKSGTRFGRLPETWSVRALDEVSEVVGGTTPSTDRDEYWGGEIPWATPSDITALESETIDGTARMITSVAVDNCALTVLPPESVLLTSRASIGEVAVNMVPMATNQGFQSLVPSDGIDSWYLFYAVSELAPYLESLGAGSTFREISNSVVKKVQVPVPPKSEQKEIVGILRSIDRTVTINKRYKARLSSVKKGLMQDLLSGKVRTHDKDIEVLDEVAAYG